MIKFLRCFERFINLAHRALQKDKELRFLKDRLDDVIDIMNSGETGIQFRVEAKEILVYLFERNEISKKEYDDYIQRYFL